MSHLTPQRRKLREELIAAANDPNSNWEAISPNTIRWMETLTTPDWAKHDYCWPQDTYERIVFINFISGSIILGIAPAPWIGRRDRDRVTIKKTREVLNNPTAVFT